MTGPGRSMWIRPKLLASIPEEDVHASLDVLVRLTGMAKRDVANVVHAAMLASLADEWTRVPSGPAARRVEDLANDVLVLAGLGFFDVAFAKERPGDCDEVGEA